MKGGGVGVVGEVGEVVLLSGPWCFNQCSWVKARRSLSVRCLGFFLDFLRAWWWRGRFLPALAKNISWASLSRYLFADFDVGLVVGGVPWTCRSNFSVAKVCGPTLDEQNECFGRFKPYIVSIGSGSDIIYTVWDP